MKLTARQYNLVYLLSRSGSPILGIISSPTSILSKFGLYRIIYFFAPHYIELYFRHEFQVISLNDLKTLNSEFYNKITPIEKYLTDSNLILRSFARKYLKKSK